MAGRIPQSFIDDLIARADIVEVINARVPLKKKGREYSACCPFHNEKTPSFTVSEAKQFYHCFGCGAHGTAIGFLMEYENLDFVEAIETLAAEFQLEVPRENAPDHGSHARDEKQTLYDILDKAAQLYQQQLRQSDRAVSYLKQRGLSGEIAKRYRLGYAPEGWDHLARHLRLSDQDWIDSGLGNMNRHNRQYDFFRGRVLFPIFDAQDRPMGFGGRVLPGSDDNRKYVNSSDSAVYNKSRVLYGLNWAKTEIVEAD